MIYHSFSLIVSRQSISSCIHKAGLSKKKTRLCYTVPQNKKIWRNTSVIAAACSDGTMKTSLPQEHPINKYSFSEFFRSLGYPPGTLIVMDNVAFHKSRIIHDIAHSKGWNILFTPPYSPGHNPIESIFSITKAIFRKTNVQFIHSQSTWKLRLSLIENSFSALSSHDIIECFREVEDHLLIPSLMSET